MSGDKLLFNTYNQGFPAQYKHVVSPKLLIQVKQTHRVELSMQVMQMFRSSAILFSVCIKYS